MSEPATSNGLLRKVVRKVGAPVFQRIDAVRDDLAVAHRSVAELSAQVEQLTAKVERLEAFEQVNRAEVVAQFDRIVTEAASHDVDDDSVAEALNARFRHGLLHTDAVAIELRAELSRELAELRGTARLAQAMAERAAASAASQGAEASEASAADDTDPPTQPRSAVPSLPVYRHAVPSFDPLYRAFEDRHRGSVEEIRRRQEVDYLELLTTTGDPELPIVDLGCGRGELVNLVAEQGASAIGVDSNLGQVADGGAGEFVEADLFEWLDGRADGSCRAVVSLHVIEHVPLELQIRLFFEARRVLADGGVLIIETPNTLSLSTAATNFWIDPTHLRPVHPLLMEFLAIEAGFNDVESRPLHPLPVEFRSSPGSSELAGDLNSLIFGSGDMALVARR